MKVLVVYLFFYQRV